MPSVRGTTIARVINLIGVEAYSQLCDAFGGTEIHPPVTTNCESFMTIKRAVGEDAALKLIREYGGDRLYVARNFDRHLAIRNDAIRAEFDSLSRDQSNAKSLLHLSRKYQLCERQIRCILQQKV